MVDIVVTQRCVLQFVVNTDVHIPFIRGLESLLLCFIRVYSAGMIDGIACITMT